MSKEVRSCQTCKYALAPNSVGCICSWGESTEFHSGTEPCAHYKLAGWMKAHEAQYKGLDEEAKQ